ncbi:MAG: DnaJ domain-containing protein [Bacteroidetes bacterium]|jgi:DnaJ like chaperone protein|nr:DnaJ domain-containing protein [Bacteroidota bacterium]MBT6687367.1 DnaJ domain-containing protein [Bacteroidota bacterium]MBT7143918.1 DnaJ domain-containing protein [Bacteroidota bacterium]MBT7492422.1 DnaJ domain-containing protein [Bacteroidota bacterium]
MGKFGKWIAGGLGWAFFGPIGGILAFAVGSVFEAKSENSIFRKGETTTGDFVVSLLVLVAAVMKADKKVLKSELNYVKEYFVRSFGEEKATEAVQMLRGILQQQIQVDDVCRQISQHLDYHSRLQLLHFLFGISKADDLVHPTEVSIIEHIALSIGIDLNDYKSIKSMFVDDTDTAYKILDVDKSASDSEVKKAYRKMAVKYHPDKVSHLGIEVQNAAKEKFQKLNEAYEKIKKERGIV